VDLSKTTADQFGKYRSWSEITTANGPFDEPSFCYEDGQVYVQNGLLHQAIASFARVHEMVPDYLPAIVSLGEFYVFARLPDRALNALKEPLANPAKFSLDDDNSTELNIITASAYIQKTNITRGVSLIEKEIAHHPKNNDLLSTAGQVYINQGLFTNALHAIKLKLELTPNDPEWIFKLAYTSMRLDHYDEAIAALTQVLALQSDNSNARFDRAVSFLNTGKLNGAREDYLVLQQTYPKSYQVAYGLGDIAWRQHETNEIVRNYTLYLENAPTNSAEAKVVADRLNQIKGKTP
jgi:tetratricopeptide (TPR) repeat protein